MKKKITLTALVLSGLLTIFQACTTGGKDTKEAGSGAQKAALPSSVDTINTFDRGNEKIVRSTWNQPVDVALGRACIDGYVANNSAKNTEYIRYSAKKLEAWLSSLKDSVEYDTIRVYMGIYTEDILKKYKKPANWKGKMTTFLVPFKGKEYAKYKRDFPSLKGDTDEGDSIKPYNMGEIYP